MNHQQEVDIEQPTRRHVVIHRKPPRWSTPQGPKTSRANPPWLPQEIAVLETYYSNGGTRKVATMLPLRSTESIRVKAFRLGLRKKPFVPHTQTFA